MAAKKKTTKKTTSRQDGAVATLDAGADSKAVETLPKGQTRAKDGTVILKSGEHLGLTKGTYEVHGSRLELTGDVFVADYNVNWLPVAKCTCKADRPEPVEIRKLPDGKWAALGTCNNKKCHYAGKTYLWIVPQDRFRV